MELKYNKQLIKYLLLPKGLQSIFFKLYVYLVPFLYVLSALNENSANLLLLFIYLFVLFEVFINPARYHINDFFDIKGDKLRRHHWNKPINEENKKIVFISIVIRLIIFIPLAFYLNNTLGFLAILLIFLQLFYDAFAKIKIYPLSLMMAAIAYPVRSLVIFFGFNFSLDKGSYFILMFIFIYTLYMLLQWRVKESYFIIKNELNIKSGTKMFAKPVMRKILDFTAVLILIVSMFAFSAILNFNSTQQVLFYVLTILSTIVFLFMNRCCLEIVIKQLHNILIAVVFLIVFSDILILQFLIPVLFPMIVSWYHRIYITKFSENYFTKKHYE